MSDEPVLPIDDHFARRALAALNQSALAIASELDIDKVLQLIVDAARDLAGARYAALAVGDWRAAGHGNVHRFVYSGMSREHKMLDRMTLEAVQACRGTPGTVDGKPEKLSGRIEYVWKLTD